MICRNCGAYCEDGMKFCENCGTALDSGYTYNEPNFMSGGSLPPKGLCIAGMATGIAALSLSCIGCCLSWTFYGLIVVFLALGGGIAGLVMSSSANKKAKECGVENSMIKTGLICSVIAIAMSGLSVIVGCVACISLIGCYGCTTFSAATNPYMYY